MIVDGKDMPGFMAAMTMPYPVTDDQTLDRIKPGDHITAEVVATENGRAVFDLSDAARVQYPHAPHLRRLHNRGLVGFANSGARARSWRRLLQW